MPGVAMTVNGKAVTGEVEARTLLVHFLRENLRLTGTHVGCDTSQCGACVVHVNGKAVKSCTMLALQATMIVLYVFARSLGSFHALALAFGVAYGGVMPIYALVTREYFGEKVMGTAYGAVFFISSIGMGLGSYTGGVIHDTLGSYQWLFLGSFLIAAMAVVLGVTLRPPTPALSPAV